MQNNLSSTMAALASSLSSSVGYQNSSLFSGPLFKAKAQNLRQFYSARLKVMAASDGSAKKPSKPKKEVEDPSVPSWAKPGSDELPPWAKQETQNDSSTFQLPFVVYLLGSAVVAIAAIGSIFEYVNQKPVFGVLNSDSVFYAPLLGFFVFTGIPSSAFLWYKSVQVANKEAEEQDRRDGYR
ncbi:hypothetical protein ABFX02_11G084700 [Erythranthe guttata]